MEKIKKRISEAISQSGMTQEELAKKIGVDRTQVSRYLHCKILPTCDSLARLCAALDLDANDILCVDDLKKEKKED